jgi:hypothetical protein
MRGSSRKPPYLKAGREFSALHLPTYGHWRFHIQTTLSYPNGSSFRRESHTFHVLSSYHGILQEFHLLRLYAVSSIPSTSIDTPLIPFQFGFSVLTDYPLVYICPSSRCSGLTFGIDMTSTVFRSSCSCKWLILSGSAH